MFNKLFKGIVRPQLEYANMVPNFKKTMYSNRKSIQRSPTKLLNKIRDESYADRLKALDLPSLKYRCL